MRRGLDAAVLAVTLSLAMAGCSTGDNPSATPTTNASAGSTGSTGTSSTTRAPASTTLQSQHGSGFQDFPQFTVPSVAKGWLIHYLYDCAGQPGNFVMYVENARGVAMSEAANEFGRRGGSTYYDDTPGTFRLSIASACAWAFEVQTNP